MGQSDGLNYICPQAMLLQDSLCPKITSQSWFELTKQSSKAHREEKTATRWQGGCLNRAAQLTSQAPSWGPAVLAV